jgi:glycosyltransferase involved in cell wall biosynthesis
MQRDRRIVLGIHVESDPERLRDTISSIFEHGDLPVALLLLLDSDDVALARFASGLCRIPMLHVGNGIGRAASFNQFVRAVDGDIYVFVESGVRLGVNCLSRMIEALDADPTHGLVGPSTNRCWNEQGAMPHYVPRAYGLELASDEIARRFGTSWRTLEPLHSLSDFCYGVTREVIDAIGAADEGYGAGPCWELDYNVRAHRAGFHGVWACGAFASRAVPNVQQAARERQLMDASKRRYQDAYCARLRQPGASYGAHCHGDRCEHFAQRDRIVLHLRQSSHLPANAVSSASASLPLVSCIMPTRGRPLFVAQAIRYFQAQDYTHTELLIAHESEADLPPIPADPRIRIVKTAVGSTIGSKRNAAVAEAEGSIIAQWDDDDWYGTTRLSLQLEPILQNIADVTGLKNTLFLKIQDEQYWQISPQLFRRLFAENVCGGTLVYRRALWNANCRYPAASMREDADFLLAAMRAGARLCRLPGQHVFIYVRHDANTWKFAEGDFLSQSEWQRVEAPACMAGDRAFYQSLAYNAAPHCNDSPLVSCIMPTAGRRDFVPQAIAHFLEQDYPNKELVIIDDGADSVESLIPSNAAIRYLRLVRRSTIGAKRNLACEMAQGTIIAHWDDDDWMSPCWLSSQVDTLLRSNADICGLDQVFFHAPMQGKAWRYVYDGSRPWVCGGTLCYTKAFWERNKFPDIDVGEDNAFLWNRDEKRIAVNKAQHLYVATVHPGNTSPKHVADRRWHDHPLQDIVQMMRTHGDASSPTRLAAS